jgi:DNA-binding CsgD family transcriptional regulator
LEQHINPRPGIAGQHRLRTPGAPAHLTFSNSDCIRARDIAESIARGAFRLEQTLHVADQSLIEGLANVSLGKLDTGSGLLTESLIATALAAWQLNELAGEAALGQRAGTAQSRRTTAEFQLNLVLVRVRLVATALNAQRAGDELLAQIRSIVAAFVFNFGIAQSIIWTPRFAEWHASFGSAFSGVHYDSMKCQVGSLGIPQPAISNHNDTRRSTFNDSRPRLSDREREVLCQIVAGLNTAEVAVQLGVKATTVATLVSRIFNKLGVNNRAAAVGIALSYGLCTANVERRAQNT